MHIVIQDPPDWLLTPSHIESSHALTLFDIMFYYFYTRITVCMSGYKISYLNNIKLHLPIRSKLSYLSNQDGVSLRINAQPCKQARWERAENERIRRRGNRNRTCFFAKRRVKLYKKKLQQIYPYLCLQERAPSISSTIYRKKQVTAYKKHAYYSKVHGAITTRLYCNTDDPKLQRMHGTVFLEGEWC